MHRAWLLAALAAFVVIGASARGDAAGDVALPYWKGSFHVPTGSTFKTTCDHAVVSASVCTNGNCSSIGSYPCAPYGCAANGECTASCTSDTQCAAGASCNLARGECATWFARCNDAWSTMSPSGEIASCAPYKCAAGYCLQACSGPGDCAPGYACKKQSTGRFACQKGTP